MKNITSLVLLLFASITSNAQSNNYCLSCNDSLTITATEISPADDNTITPPYINSTTIESFVEQMSPSAWDDKANSVVYDASDDSYVFAGNTSDASYSAGSEDFFVVKTDIEGTLIWAKVIGSTSTDVAFDVETSHDGGYVILGHTRSNTLVTAGSDAGDYDMMVTKLNASGNHVWTKVFGTDENDINEDCSIMRTSDNGFVIVGQAAKWTTSSRHVIHFHKLDASGNLIATKELEPTSGNTNGANAVIQTSDGGFAIAGHANYDHYVAKLNSDFTFDWSLKWTGGSGYEEIEAIVENAANDYTVFGTTNAVGPGITQDNMYAMRFSYDGTGAPSKTWEKTIGTGTSSDNFDDGCYSAVSSGDGGYIMAGFTDVADDSEYDSYLLKLDGAGNLVWETLIEAGGTAWNDRRQARDIVKDAHGGYAIANKGFYCFEMIRINPSGSSCISSTHTGLITNITANPSVTINPGSFSATSYRTMSSVSRTPTINNGGSITQECKTLPVNIASIDLMCNNGVASINWTTVSEKNNDFFTVEKSENGKVFKPIGIIKGAGNSSTSLNYSFTDNLSSSDAKYYRLKQTDYNGEFIYSQVKMVKCKEFDSPSISLYPNPASTNFTFTYHNSSNNDLNILILTPLGKVVMSKNYEKTSYIKETLSLDNLNNGVFYVVFSTSSFKETYKLIVSK